MHSPTNSNGPDFTEPLLLPSNMCAKLRLMQIFPEAAKHSLQVREIGYLISTIVP